MKISTQNILTIVPIFLGMALLNGILTYTTQHQEIIWGMNQEISAITTSTAQFLDRKIIKELKENPQDEALSKRLSILLNRVKNWGKKQSIYLLYPDTEEAFFQFTTREEEMKIPDFEVNTLEFQRGERELIIGDIKKISDSKAILTAYAPIYYQRELLAILLMEIDGEYYLNRTNEIKLRIFIITLLVIVIGIVAALLIAQIITQKIRQLNEATLIVETGEYNYRVNITTIQEMIDLSNTFNTMSCVLEEVLSKTKRTLFEREQFRTNKNLGDHFRKNFSPPITGEFNNIYVGGRIVTEEDSGDFFDVFNVGKAIYVLFGMIRKKGALQTIINSSATCNFIKQKLEQKEILEVFEDANKLFDIEVIKCLHWVSPGNVVHYHQFKSDHIKQEKIDLEADKTIFFSTMSRDNEKNVHFFVESYSYISPEELMESLMNLIVDEGFGSIVLIQKIK